MADKHYWKRNEILFLKESVEKHEGRLMIHWSAVQDDFNSKYSYDLTIDELKTAYEIYFRGGRRK